MPPDRPARRGARGRVIATLVVTFLALVLGLAVVDVIVLRTLRPQLAELSRIGQDHVRAMEGATRLRERIDTLRRRITATVLRSTPPFDPSPEFREIDAITADLRAVCDTSVEKAALGRVEDGTRRARALALAVGRVVAAGHPVDGTAALEEFADAAAEASRAADDIVQFNAGQVRDEAFAIHDALTRAMLATSALAILVVVAALFLLRNAVRSVTSHSRHLEFHADEMAAFAARAAHELRSPLQALSLSLAAVRKRTGGSPSLDRAEASAGRLSATIEEILEFSRSGGDVAEEARCRVAPVVAQIREEEAARAAEHVEIRCEVDDREEVAMSEGHLRTIVSNLVGNAVKHGGREVTVTVARSAGRVTIAVRDDGPGIPAPLLSRIFEPFFRATTHREGYGLGLATVKRLVEAHEGRIDVTSAPGAGTTFSVELPAGEGPARQGAGGSG